MDDRSFFARIVLHQALDSSFSVCKGKKTASTEREFYCFANFDSLFNHNGRTSATSPVIRCDSWWTLPEESSQWNRLRCLPHLAWLASLYLITSTWSNQVTKQSAKYIRENHPIFKSSHLISPPKKMTLEWLRILHATCLRLLPTHVFLSIVVVSKSVFIEFTELLAYQQNK